MKNKDNFFKEQEQIAFLNELGELSKAGYSLSDSLDMIATAHDDWQKRLQKVRSQLESGKTSAVALSMVLGKGVSTYLELGQSHGHFDKTLILLANNLEQILRYQRKIKQILTYPVFLFVCLLGIVVGMEFYLYPIFDSFAGSHSGSQNFALVSLHLVVGIVLLCIAAGILFACCLRKMTPLSRLMLLSKIPFLRMPTRFLMTYLLAEQLGILLVAGLSLPVIIERFTSVENNGKKLGLATELARSVQEWIQDGKSITSWIEAQPFLSISLAGYLNRGFTTVATGNYLIVLAKNQYARFEQQIRRLLGLLQPLFFAIIGVTIVLLYLAMLLPLYQNIGGITG